jgi:C-terminal processing protease CtpA/Prc
VRRVCQKLIVLALFWSIPLLCAGQTPDSVRVARLAGLAKVWGAIKYFHPSLADQDIDWDSALVQAIPKVEAANSAEDYRQAVEFMLSFLHDASSHTMRDSSAPAKPNALLATNAEPHQPYVKWIDPQTALIVANDYRYFSGSSKRAGDLAKVLKEASGAPNIILDARNSDKNPYDDFTFWYSSAFRKAIPILIDRDITATSLRSRTYSGYPSQAGGFRGYYSAFVTQDGTIIHGEAAKEQKHRIVFLVNAGSTGFLHILGGMQAAGLATVVEEGDAGQEEGEVSIEYDLPENIKVMMRVSEVVNPDGSIGFHPDVVVPESVNFSGDENQAILAAIRSLGEEHRAAQNSARRDVKVSVIKREKPYPEMKFPLREYRLLALCRFWNVMLYFHPYLSLYDHPWDETLTEFIPQFEADRDELEYDITTARLVARTDDTHAFMQTPALQEAIGTSPTPVDVKLIEGKTIVTKIDDESVRKSSGLAIGDQILAVDGVPIEARRQWLAELYSASTPQALSWLVSQAVLLGPRDKPAELKIRDAAGQVKEVPVTRASSGPPAKDETPIFRVLPDGFGFIDLTRLEPSQVDEAFEVIRSTPAVIFDMRGYPHGVFPLLGARFAEQKTAAALFETPLPQSPLPSDVSRERFFQYAEPDTKWKYHGRVVVLINEDAISQAEHTCLFLEATAHAIFVGSPTNGADGDVTQTVLPGNIFVSFSGHDVRHADGRQLQRIGIQPDVKVEPTIKGIREGRDEVLERAVAYLKTGK